MPIALGTTAQTIKDVLLPRAIRNERVSLGPCESTGNSFTTQSAKCKISSGIPVFSRTTAKYPARHGRLAKGFAGFHDKDVDELCQQIQELG